MDKRLEQEKQIKKDLERQIKDIKKQIEIYQNLLKKLEYNLKVQNKVINKI